MKPRQIREDIYWVGAIDWDRRLFDSLIPLPDGTSYNSYIIRGSEKTVLVDSVDPLMVQTLMSQLGNIESIDYVIAHHAEQDHSGAIPTVLDKYEQAKVITTPKGKAMLADLLRIADDRFITVQDGERLSLGNKTLEFIYTPWVHWPETMCTYLAEDRVLFSCDFFGSHIATTDLYAVDQPRVYEAAKRYFGEIMVPFRTIIQKNLAKLKDREIDLIAPSHGPIYDRPRFIMDAYADWASDQPKNIVALPYVSMHDSTRKMVEHLVASLADREVTVNQFDLAGCDIGKLAITLVDAGTIVIGTPTVLMGAHPLAGYAAFLANILRPKAKFASIIGSYGWSTKVVEQIASLIPNLKVEVLEPVLCKGYPSDEVLSSLDRLAATIADKHAEHGFGAPGRIEIA
ncbi:MAG: FprA family A-type flavoprotein [Thermodesulfobacteriota bacterium]